MYLRLVFSESVVTEGGGKTARVVCRGPGDHAVLPSDNEKRPSKADPKKLLSDVTWR